MLKTVTNSINASQIQTPITLPGNVTLSTGNLIQGTAGRGVNFTANTPAAGMSSQLLNWYEEGLWTPVLNGFTVIGTTTLQGNYYRVGSLIFVRCQISATTSIASLAGNSYITGLPFGVGNLSSECSAGLAGSLTSLGGGMVHPGSNGLWTPGWTATSQVIVVSAVYAA